jgi:hypothetical protein
MTFPHASSSDQRLQMASDLLTRPRQAASGLAIMLAAVALLLSGTLLARTVTHRQPIAHTETPKQPSADFQLSGSAFSDSAQTKVLPSGSEASG